MTSADDLPESSLLFFKSLFLKTAGEIQKQVSMHDIGNACGLDKAASRMIAEELMSLGLIDIRTLSGGIGMTEEGALEARNLFAADMPGSGVSGITLGHRPLVDEKIAAAITDILTGIKARAGNLGMDFDNLTELIADIQTLEAQMRSPKPKTAIVRECFRSMHSALLRIRETELRSRIEAILAE